MPTSVDVAVLHCSPAGTVATTAEVIAEHTGKAGAKVRLRKAAGHAPQAVIVSTPARAARTKATAAGVQAEWGVKSPRATKTGLAAEN
jgi:NAD(P)H dehydrogenase (quinone)